MSNAQYVAVKLISWAVGPVETSLLSPIYSRYTPLTVSPNGQFDLQPKILFNS